MKPISAEIVKPVFFDLTILSCLGATFGRQVQRDQEASTTDAV